MGVQFHPSLHYYLHMLTCGLKSLWKLICSARCSFKLFAQTVFPLGSDLPDKWHDVQRLAGCLTYIERCSRTTQCISGLNMRLNHSTRKVGCSSGYMALGKGFSGPDTCQSRCCLKPGVAWGLGKPRRADTDLRFPKLCTAPCCSI